MSESKNGKTLLIVGGGILGFVILLLIIVFIASLFKKKSISYEKLELRMVEAAKSYYKKNPKLLPHDNEETTLSYETLSSNGFIDPLKDLVKGGENCTAYVLVDKKTGTHLYTPFLNCPGSYETVELYKLLIDKNNIVTSGSGLYKDNNEYYFKGEVTNNYIKLGEIEKYSKKVDNLWRIISIKADNTIKIKSLNNTGTLYVWDDRYNEQKRTNYGYNDFEVSRIKDTLKSLEKDDVLMEAKYKSKLVKKNICVGKRRDNDEDITGILECSVMSNDMYMFGLISPYEHMKASLDANCNSTISRSCSNYNYLASNKNSEWTLTAFEDNNYQVYSYDGSVFTLSTAYNRKNIYPTAFLDTKTFYVSGTGTYSDPYIIK